MSNQIFHFSNTGISSGQRFYLKDDVSGIFVRNLKIDSNFPILGSNLVYTTGNQTISGIKTFDVLPIVSGNRLITGVDLSSYSTNANLFATGSTLDNKINSLSGYVNSRDIVFSGQTSNTGSRLDTKINSLSGYINSPASNIVFTTGNQKISGDKNFVENVIFGDQTQDDLLLISGNKITFGVYPTVNGTGIVYNQGNQIISGVKTFDVPPIVSGNRLITGVDLSSYSTNANLFATGSTLDNKINSLSGYVNSRDIVFSGQTSNTGSRLDTKINSLSGYVNSQNILFSGQTASTGSILDNKINSLSGYVNSQDIVFSGQTFNTGSRLDNKINSLSGYVNTQDIIFSGQTFNTGSRLDNKINALSGYVTGITETFGTLPANLYSTGSTLDNKINSLSGYVNSQDNILSGQTFNTGSRLDDKINSLSGYVDSKSITLATTIVYITGDQIISGNKTFINNIAIAGTGSFNSVKVSSIDKLFLSGIDIIITGNSSINAYNAIYISGNAVLTGVLPTTQSISNVVYTTGNQLISGNKTFLNNISVSGTGDFNNVKVSSIDKLFLSGIDILITGNSSINVYNAIYISGNQVLTGVMPSSQTLTNVVFTTGNQVISGNKTFLNNVNISGTGSFNAVKVSSIDKLFLSGVDIVVTGNSSINVYNAIYISGNQVLTGLDLSLYATSANLVNTSSILNNEINSLSGYVDAKSIVLPTTIVYATGNQIISGTKTFVNNLEVQGTGIFNALDLSNISEFNFSGTNINLTNGNVNISGGTIYISGNQVSTGVDLKNYYPDLLNFSNNFYITETQNSKMILANSSTIITGMIVSGNSVGYNTSITQVGIGQIYITGSGNGITVNSYLNQYKTAGKFAVASLLHTGNNQYILYGNLST